MCTADSMGWIWLNFSGGKSYDLTLFQMCKIISNQYKIVFYLSMLITATNPTSAIVSGFGLE